MAMIDTCRNNITRKKGQLARLSQDKANENKKMAAQQQKILSAKKILLSTKSQSTVKSKLTEISRAETEIAKANGKIATIEKNMAQKEKDITVEEKKFQVKEKKRLEGNKREMTEITNTLKQHGQTQQDLQRAIVDLQNIPEKIKVLFMASNSTSSAPLRLDEEARAIHETITKALRFLAWINRMEI